MLRLHLLQLVPRAVMKTFRQRKSTRVASLARIKLGEQTTVLRPFGLAHGEAQGCPAPKFETLRSKTRKSKRETDATVVEAVFHGGVSSRPQSEETLSERDSIRGELDLKLASEPRQRVARRKRGAGGPANGRSIASQRNSTVGVVAEESEDISLPSSSKQVAGKERKRERKVSVQIAANTQGELQPVAAVKTTKRRKTENSEEPKLSQKALLLTIGASRDRSVWTEESMADATQHLCKVDSKLAAVIERIGPTDRLWPKGNSNMFASLARSIVAQQLATQAVIKIYGRFLDTCKVQKPNMVQPEDVLAIPFEELKACGLSGMKANYIIDLAKHFQSGQLSDQAISEMDDEALITELTKVKGIGRWSVDMFAMFHLGRQDVLPIGDLGVRKGIMSLYGLKVEPKPLELEKLTDAWRPYRSLGSLYMWRVIEKKGASESKVPAQEEVSKVPM